MVSVGEAGLTSRELAVAAYATKPLRHSELLDAVMTSLGKVAHPRVQPAGQAVAAAARR